MSAGAPTRVTVKLFGPQAQLAGCDAVTLEFPNAEPTCGGLRARLAEQVPALAASLPASRFAVNHVFADDAATVRETDEVALIGLVSGG